MMNDQDTKRINRVINKATSIMRELMVLLETTSKRDKKTLDHVLRTSSSLSRLAGKAIKQCAVFYATSDHQHLEAAETLITQLRREWKAAKTLVPVPTVKTAKPRRTTKKES